LVSSLRLSGTERAASDRAIASDDTLSTEARPAYLGKVNARRVGRLGAALLSAAVAVAGCGGSTGGSGGQASCTRTESLPDGGASLKMCEELTGSAQIVQAVRQICMTDAGGETEQFANGPCSRVGALGGCSFTAGTTVTTVWYYAGSVGPQTTADVQMTCAGAGDTFVPP